jgi:hypothetical protein
LRISGWMTLETLRVFALRFNKETISLLAGQRRSSCHVRAMKRRTACCRSHGIGFDLAAGRACSPAPGGASTEANMARFPDDSIQKARESLLTVHKEMGTSMAKEDAHLFTVNIPTNSQNSDGRGSLRKEAPEYAQRSRKRDLVVHQKGVD